MADKFDIFNNLKLDEECEETKLSLEEKDNIKKRMNYKLKRKNRKKYVLVASISFIVLSMMSINSDVALAYIENIERKIEAFLGLENDELKEYKVEKSMIAKDRGIKLEIKEVLLDDRKLILNMEMDYSKFKHKALEKDSLRPSIPTIKFNNVVFAGQSGSIQSEIIEPNKKNILVEVDLYEIDTDGDMVGDTPYEILNNIYDNKIYDIEIEFNSIDYRPEDDEPLWFKGNWKFKTKIDATNIMKEIKVEKINKDIKIKEENYKGTLTIEEIRVSPVSVKVKYKFKSDSNTNYTYQPDLVAIDENGKEYSLAYSGTGEGGTMYFNGEFIRPKDTKEFKLVPVIYYNEGTKYLYDDIGEFKIP